MRKIVFTLLLIIPCSLVSSQEARFIGLIDETLVEVNPYEPSLETIVRYNFPNNGSPSDMAYSPQTCLFYTIIDAVGNPKLVSFDFLGNVELIGQFTIENGTVSSVEGIAYDEGNDLMFISGSLNGEDFFSETLMTVDLNNAECRLVTRFIFDNGVSADIDNMVIANGILYFNDGQPGLSVADHYTVPLINLDFGVYSISPYFQTSYAGSSDVVYFQDSLFYPALNFRLLSHVPIENIESNLGFTHVAADYNGARIRGLEYIEGLIDFNYNQQAIDTILCNNGSVDISLESTGLDVQWNTGETGNNITMDEEGFYYADISLNGCLLSITDTFSLTYIQSLEGELELPICNGMGVTINNITYDQPGDYIQTLTNSSGICDSTLNISITTGAPYFINESVSICAGESYIIGDSTYSESGIYLTTIESTIDCDSFITTELILNEETQGFVEVFECSEPTVEVNGVIYDLTGDYIQSLENVMGCDSILNINIMIEDIISINQSYELCDGEILEVYDLTIDSPGTWEVKLVSDNNLCDTLIELTVTFNGSTTGLETYTICEGESIDVNGTNYSTTGTYDQNLINHNNCDSLLIIEILVEAQTNAFMELTNCEGLLVTVNDTEYESPGMYTQVLNGKNGCDSILQILYETTNIYIPNIFSPDQPANDTFKPFLTCDVTFYELHIFDRWGNLVFVTEEQEAAWDGDIANAGVGEQGVYVYMLKYGLNEETAQIIAGDITLIR